MPTNREQAELLIAELLERCLSTKAFTDAITAALDQAAAEATEQAAKWHDQRARDTPDAFEMEFHQVSAAAIRAQSLSPSPTSERESIVAWLRKQASSFSERDWQRCADELANAIEQSVDRKGVQHENYATLG